MRIRDLFEGEMILLESYKDFSAVWQRLIQDVTQTGSVPTEALTVPQRLEKLLRDQRSRAIIGGNKRKIKYSEFIVLNMVDISSWVSSLQGRIRAYQQIGGDIAYVIDEVIAAVETIEDFVEKELIDRNPDYTTVAKTPSYIIFDVKNFAAAKKLRDQVGSTWCIGANEGHFESYGEDQRRKTYIVFLLKTRKGMVIHVNPSNPSDNLVTSHSNETEAVVRGGEMVYTRMHTSVDYEIERDLADAVPSHDIVELFRQVGIRLKNTPITTTTTSSLPMHILVDFTNRLNGRDIMFSKTIKNIVVRSEARYEGMYKSGDVRAMSRHLASIIDMTMLSISVELDFVSDVKEVIAMFSLVSAIASHVHELQLEGFLPKNLPSDDLDSIVNMSIIDMKRYGTVTKTASIAIDNMRKYQKQLENVRI